MKPTRGVDEVPGADVPAWGCHLPVSCLPLGDAGHRGTLDQPGPVLPRSLGQRLGQGVGVNVAIPRVVQPRQDLRVDEEPRLANRLCPAIIGFVRPGSAGSRCRAKCGQITAGV